jgi:hypothetical protein
MINILKEKKEKKVGFNPTFLLIVIFSTIACRFKVSLGFGCQINFASFYKILQRKIYGPVHKKNSVRI